ncbi:hypothetical protein EI74_0490 [Mycoplasma testudineum]|uniref:Uncharacterized protein n=1 Tax=Mycoplasma testudineum TaxID=244584 RepID=A0A4R6IEF0_9MOLU|nr:hypothetical protein [Mycoplasma testudineum]OYD26877.1 hypothetical protein CG473_02070 [Mycoplasma testudineum]TDO20412.1 hypothetical protein EI74_0490 [Mycoplasma testudineum]
MAKFDMKKLDIRKIFKKNKTDEKKRNIKSWIVLGTLAGAISLGVGIPVGIVNNTVTQTPVESGSNTLVTFKDANGNIRSFSIDEVFNLSKTAASKNEETFNKFAQSTIELMYEEERVMSETLLAAFQKSTLETSTLPTGFSKLTPLSEIKASQQAVIAEQKSNLQRQFGFSNWQAQFNNLLTTNETYGKTGTEEGAVNFLVKQAISADANRRFNASIISSLNDKTLKATVSENITFTGDIPSLGIKAGDTYLNSGDKIFQNYFVSSADTTSGLTQASDNNNVNAVVDTTQVENSRSTRIFSTTSFLNFLPSSFKGKFTSASDLVSLHLKNNSNAIYQISNFIIPITADATNLNGNWTITKANFKSLVNYSFRNNLANSLLSENGILKYAGAKLFDETISEEAKTQIANDNFWLNTRSSNTTKTNHGFLSFGPINDIYNAINTSASSTNMVMTLAMAKSISTNQDLFSTSVIDPNTNANWNPISRLYNALIADQTFSPLFKKEDGSNVVLATDVTKDNVELLNTNMNEKIDNISSDDFQVAINRVLDNAFSVGPTFNTANSTYQSTENNARKLSYYDATNDVYIVVNASGINVVKRDTVNTVADYQKYILNDLYDSLFTSQSQRFSYGSITDLNQYNTDSYNMKNFVELNNINADSITNQSALGNYYVEKLSYQSGTVNDEIAKVIAYANNTISTNKLTTLKTLTGAANAFVSSAFSNKTYVDFAILKTQTSVVAQKEFTEKIYEALKAQLGLN